MIQLSSQCGKKISLFRFNAFNRNPKTLDEELKPYSLYEGGAYVFPLDHYKKYRVIVSTCTCSGYFVSYSVPKGYFTHIFVDEAGQSLAPENLIPWQMADEKVTSVSLISLSLSFSHTLLSTSSYFDFLTPSHVRHLSFWQAIRSSLVL